MDWLNEIEFEDLLNNDMSLVQQECGTDTLKMLWEKLSGINIYISERSLFEAKKRYIRKFHNTTDPRKSIKLLAVKLKCSEKFVEESLQTTGIKDDRQQSLL